MTQNPLAQAQIMYKETNYHENTKLNSRIKQIKLIQIRLLQNEDSEYTEVLVRVDFGVQ